MNIEKLIYAENIEVWRKWLECNHDCSNEIFLCFFKNEKKKEFINYDDAVCEALCWGWIDSIIYKIDEERYCRKFTPRKPDSNWSDANKIRIIKLLKEEGRVQPSGMATINKFQDRKKLELKTDRPKIDGLPEFILNEFKKNQTAWNYFQSLAPSHKRAFRDWICSAKKDETKARRLEKSVKMLENSRKLDII